MFCEYILVTVRGKDLSVLAIRIFDPNDDSEPDCESMDPYSFSEGAVAYTGHGMPLRRGTYAWGDDGDLFPYSEELFQTLRQFERTNDISGYADFFVKRAEYVPGINSIEE